jgi:hypothetical protein
MVLVLTMPGYLSASRPRGHTPHAEFIKQFLRTSLQSLNSATRPKNIKKSQGVGDLGREVYYISPLYPLKRKGRRGFINFTPSLVESLPQFYSIFITPPLPQKSYTH